MFKRKIEDDLKRWKAMPKRPTLFVKGPRGCGKSTSIEAFAKENYKNVGILRFDQNPHYRQFFHEGLNSKMLNVFISTLCKKLKIVPGETLIIFDELFDCPQVRAALENLAGDPRFDMIATSSCYDMKRARNTPDVNAPHVAELRMYTMDFEEYLWAHSSLKFRWTPELTQNIRESMLQGKSVYSDLDQRLRDMYLRYALVGGFPTVVHDFVKYQSPTSIQLHQRRVIQAIHKDLFTYVPVPEEAAKYTMLSLPPQMAKNNRRFDQALLGDFSSVAQCSDVLTWMERSGYVKIAKPTVLPLDEHTIDTELRAYTVDAGLFMQLSGMDHVRDLYNYRWENIHPGYMENLTAALLNNRFRTMTYCFNDAMNFNVPIVIHQVGEPPMLVDVKPCGGRRTMLERSLATSPATKARAVLFCDGPASTKSGILKLPLYAAGFI